MGAGQEADRQELLVRAESRRTPHPRATTCVQVQRGPRGSRCFFEIAPGPGGRSKRKPGGSRTVPRDLAHLFWIGGKLVGLDGDPHGASEETDDSPRTRRNSPDMASVCA